MRPARTPPLVPIAAALLTGAACGGDSPSPHVCCALLVAALLTAGAFRRRPALVVAASMMAAWCAGAGLQAISWRDGTLRLSGLLHGDALRDAELSARVLAAPERRIDGTRSLLVETAGTEAAPAARVRLEIVAVPPDDCERVDGLRRGDLVLAWCRLRAPTGGPGTTESDARRRLAAERLDATARVKSSRLVRRVSAGPRSIGRTIDELHVAALRRLDIAFDPAGTTRAVLGAMLLGDRGLLSSDVNALLRDAGLVHLLSISGLHTAMTVLVLLAILRRSGAGPRGLLLAGGAALFVFAALVGHGASVWRACGSLGVALIARLLGREMDALASLALAAAALVVAVPALAWSTGFQLSVLATAGLVAFASRGEAFFGKEGAIRRGLAASAGAYAATIPILAERFGRLAPVALVANLAAAPLCAACLGAGATAVACARVPLVGPLTALAADRSVAALIVVSRWAAAFPGGHLRVAPPGPVLATAYVIALLAAWQWDAVRGRQVGHVLRLAVVLLAIAIHVGPSPPGTGPARVEILDVGQGLSVMLRGPTGTAALYDAGPAHGGRFDAGDRIVVPALAAQGFRRIEVLALSHDHDDHAGGALAVLRDVDVGELWLAGGSEADRLTRTISAEAVARGVAVRRLRRGQILRAAGLHFDVLNPATADRTRPVNDRCLALRAVTERGAALVLPGDLEADGERALLRAGAAIAGDALVAPHHGADGSSTVEFLASVGARIVVISAGVANRFGHPGKAALARFAAAGARVARTDRDGAVVLEDGPSGWRLSVDDDRSRDEGEDEDRGE